MPPSLYDVRSAYLVVGLVYAAMAMATWSILHRRHDPRSTGLWCAGAAMMGAGCVLVGLRGSAPDWLSFLGGNALVFASFATRIGALRCELDRPLTPGAMAAAVAVASLGYLLAWRSTETHRLVYLGLAVALGSAGLSVFAWQLAQRRRLRSAWLLAACYGALAGVLLLEIGSLAASEMAPRFDDRTPLRMGLFVVSLVAGLYGNLGFIGLALEGVRERAQGQSLELAVQRAQRDAAERSSGALQALIDERDEMLRVLAHEVRRPLLNASAVLLGARQVLDAGQDAGAHPATLRIVRAQDVLRRILGRIDGTLVATEVLAGQARLRLDTVDIARLLEDAREGLSPGERERVSLEFLAQQRHGRLDSRLLRAALGNLLDHALRQSAAAGRVGLRVRDGGAALLIEVECGCPPQQLESARRQAGLALAVAQKVARLHGGELSFDALPDRILARLGLPRAAG